MKKAICLLLALLTVMMVMSGCGTSAKDKEIAALKEKAAQSKQAADAAKKEHDKNQALVKDYYSKYNQYK